jgi:hypothetical protein
VRQAAQLLGHQYQSRREAIFIQALLCDRVQIIEGKRLIPAAGEGEAGVKALALIVSGEGAMFTIALDTIQAGGHPAVSRLDACPRADESHPGRGGMPFLDVEGARPKQRDPGAPAAKQERRFLQILAADAGHRELRPLEQRVQHSVIPPPKPILRLPTRLLPPVPTRGPPGSRRRRRAPPGYADC